MFVLLIVHFDRLSLLSPVLFLSILSKSFQASKAGNVKSVKGHCNGFHVMVELLRQS